jgi:PAS domain S-box-containing protein
MKDKSKTKQELIEELDSLKQRVVGYERLESTYRIVEKRLHAINECLLSLGNDMGENISRLTALTGELLGATAAIYNRLEGDLLIAIGQWQTPPDFRTKDRAQGHICYDVIRKNEERIIHIRNLAESPYAGSDPNVCAYGLATYVGHVVRWGPEPIGSLCVVFQQDYIPTADDERLLGIMAASIGEQEKRWRNENALRKSEDKYRILIETTDTGFVIIDQDGLVLDANSEYVRLTGYDNLSEIVGRSVLEWTADYEKEKNAAAVKACFDKGYIRNFEIDYVDRNGKITPIEVNATCLEIDGKIQTITICRNITERKKAEEEIMASEERFRVLSSLATEGMMIREGNTILDANQAFARLCGYASPQELIGKNGVDVVPFTPDSRQKIIDRIRAGSTSTYDVNIIAPDGSIKSYEVNGQAVPFLYKGKQVRIVFMRDITERKQAENALAESEEKYRLVVENAKEAIVITQDLKVVFVNNAAVDITGYSKEILASRPFSDFIHPDDLNMVLENHIKRLKGENPLRVYSYRIFCSDGSIKWAETNSIIVQWRGRPAVLNFLNDITDRKQAEDALRVSEEKFSKTFSKAPLLMSVNEIESGAYIDVNEKWTEASGFSREEALGKTSLELGFMSREDAILLAKKLKDQKIIENMEFYLLDKNKKQICCLFSSEVITIGGKQVLLSISQDITEKKKIETEKANLEERLQRTEKMEALGTLAGGVAHDLNNVLGVIVGYSELLLHETDKLSPIRPRLTKIMGGSEKAAAIVQDLLTLARRSVPVRQVLNLNKIILDFQNSPELEKLLDYNSAVRIKRDLEPDLLNISGSSIHLGKALSNLVSNAAEAMPQGGDLIIKTANQYLDKPIHGYDEVREGDYVVLSVTDTGEGIPAADIHRIFEPFYTKKVMGRSGTGLGLAVIWGTVKDHLGYINVQSEEGKGSTFTLYFPVTRENLSAELTTVAASEYIGKGEMILVVDDIREQRELAAEMLKKLNYQVSAVASGEDAITYIKDHKIDLLVLDMIMYPGMDGLDTYRKVLEIKPGQKAIIVSGFSETERVNEAHALGAGAYVKKPYVLEKLGMAVRKELDRKKAEKG